VLESKDLPGAVELAELAREMRKHHVTPRQCNQVLPLVVLFRDLKIDPHLIPDLLEAALQFGGKDFPRDEYAAAIARIHKREKETGLRVDEVEAAHRAVTGEVEELRAERDRLQTEISGHRSAVTNLRNQSSRLTGEVEEKQRRVDALDGRIASEATTLQELNAYAGDKLALRNLGFDIRNLGSVRASLSSLASMGYDPVRVVSTINQIGNLQPALLKLLGEAAQKQKERDEAVEAKGTVLKEIRDLEERKKEEEKRVKQAREEADRMIAQVWQGLDKKMKAAQTTEADLADYIRDREALRRLGVKA
jgi:chromosome segregation ATPase